MKCPKCELEWNNENSEYVPTEGYIYCYECQGYIVSIDGADYINEMYQQRLDKVLSKFYYYNKAQKRFILDKETRLEIMYSKIDKEFHIIVNGCFSIVNVSLDTVESILKDLGELND